MFLTQVKKENSVDVSATAEADTSQKLYEKLVACLPTYIILKEKDDYFSTNFLASPWRHL